MIKWFSGQKQNYVSTQTPACVWERCGLKEMQLQDGKVKWKNSPLLGENCWESMEKQLNSSGIFQGFTSLQILPKIQKYLQEFTDWIIFMSMFNDVDRKKKGNDEINLYSKFRESPDIREEILAGTLDVPRSWRWKEVVWKETCPPKRKWDSVASPMVQRFKETSHPVFTSANALSRGILRMLKRKETIRSNADALNTKLLFPIINSVNQLSIYGAVSNWCEQFGLTKDEKGKERNLDKEEFVNKGAPKSVNSQEANSPGSSPRLASGNSLRENIQDFETLSETIQFARVCEDASFRYKYRLVWGTGQNLTRKTVLDKPSHYAKNTHFLE